MEEKNMTTHSSSNQEIIICAAIKLSNNIIIRCHRHADGFRVAIAHGWNTNDRVEGFITSKNRFVDRKEAWLIQYYAGAPSANPRGYSQTSELYSEDLY